MAQGGESCPDTLLWLSDEKQIQSTRSKARHRSNEKTKLDRLKTQKKQKKKVEPLIPLTLTKNVDHIGRFTRLRKTGKRDLGKGFQYKPWRVEILV